MHRNKHVAQVVVVFLTTIMVCGASLAKDVPEYKELVSNRESLTKWLAADKTGAEFYTESKPSDDGAETSIAFFIEGVSLEEAGENLDISRAWCEIMFLHLNVKACLYDKKDYLHDKQKEYEKQVEMQAELTK